MEDMLPIKLSIYPSIYITTSLFDYLYIYLGFKLDSGTWHSVHVLRSGRHVVYQAIYVSIYLYIYLSNPLPIYLYIKLNNNLSRIWIGQWNMAQCPCTKIWETCCTGNWWSNPKNRDFNELYLCSKKIQVRKKIFELIFSKAVNFSIKDYIRYVDIWWPIMYV